MHIFNMRCMLIWHKNNTQIWHRFNSIWIKLYKYSRNTYMYRTFHTHCAVIPGRRKKTLISNNPVLCNVDSEYTFFWYQNIGSCHLNWWTPGNYGWMDPRLDKFTAVSLTLCLSLSVPVFVSTFYLSIYLSICLSVCLSIHLSIYLSKYQSIFIYLSI